MQQHVQTGVPSGEVRDPQNWIDLHNLAFVCRWIASLKTLNSAQVKIVVVPSEARTSEPQSQSDSHKCRLRSTQKCHALRLTMSATNSSDSEPFFWKWRMCRIGSHPACTQRTTRVSAGDHSRKAMHRLKHGQCAFRRRPVHKNHPAELPDSAASGQ